MQQFPLSTGRPAHHCSSSVGRSRVRLVAAAHACTRQWARVTQQHPSTPGSQTLSRARHNSLTKEEQENKRTREQEPAPSRRNTQPGGESTQAPAQGSLLADLPCLTQ
ncbi:MAG: hypothetical protein OXC07_05075 [Kistimonas sp.]|nr:hypothetical protein [Kistimonas sp.]